MKKLVLTVISFWIMTGILKAQDAQQEQRSYVNNVAVGFYIGYPVAGITGIYNPTAQWGIQGLADISGNRQSLAGRILYRFLTRERTNTYGYGMVGGFEGIDDDSFGLGFGAGAGVEYSWQAFSETLPPIWGSVELGVASWDGIDGNTTQLTLNVGLYYYF